MPMAVFVIFLLILACELEIQLLVGKEFNRDIRGFTFVFEALKVLFIVAFIHWCRTFDYIDQMPSAFWNALFEFHRSICDQTIETAVLHFVLTKVEELFEDHVQPLISKIRKWGCDVSGGGSNYVVKCTSRTGG